MDRELRITGEGKLSFMPDTVVICLPVESICKKYSDAIESLHQKVKIVHGILKKNSLNKKDLKTTNFDINEEWKYYSNDNQEAELIGFKASHELKLELPLDNKLISSVLNDISESETGIAFRLRFDVSDKKKYDEVLIKDAIKNAKLSANFIAESTGVKLKEIIRIDYSFSEVCFQETEFLYESSLESKNFIPDFTPEDINAKKNITVIWRIE